MPHNTVTFTTRGQHLTLFLNHRSLFSITVSPDSTCVLTAQKEQNQHVLWLQHAHTHVRLYQSCDEALFYDVFTRTTQALSTTSARSTLTRTACMTFALSAIISLALTAGLFIGHSLATPRIPTAATSTQPLLPTAPAGQTPPTAQDTVPILAGKLTQQEMAQAQQQLAERLKTAADKKDFTVTLSSGHARTLYLFSDPECNNCRIFEPTIQALATTWNVEIFPVTLVGKARTAQRVAPLLCSAPQTRAERWRNLFDPGAGLMNIKPVNPQQAGHCEAGYEALARNDMAFDMYALPGTPTVISDDGRMIPLQAMTSEAALVGFLEQKTE